MAKSIDVSTLSAEQKRALLAQLLREQAGASPHPISYGQRALWFLNQLSPGSTAYNITYAAYVRSDVDATILRRSVEALVDRHPILRTTYAAHDGQPVQHVHWRKEADFEVVEAATWTWQYLTEWRRKEADRPFDLQQGPVLRVKLLRRAGAEHILLLTVHHIAVDFWSLDVLLDNLRDFYDAIKADRPLPRHPANQREYVDYVSWQAAMLESPEGEQHWHYWRAQLSRHVGVVNIPTDRPRPTVQTYNGTLHRFQLDEELVCRLKDLTKIEGTTLYVTILAAYQVLLSRYCCQEDFLVGSPMVGRSLAGLEETVGHFVNPVVLRADLSGDPTFVSLLGRVRETVLGALEHQDFPFALLVERLQPPRDLSRSPLFQVAFAWDKPRHFDRQGASRLDGNEGSGCPQDGKLEFRTLTVEQGGAQFDLMLIVHEQDGSLAGAFEYNSDLFDADTIARMERHFLTLLNAIVAGSDRPISDFPLLTPTEARQVLLEWNDTEREFPQDHRLHRLVEGQVERTPDAVAVTFADRHITYGELNRRANQVAHRLRSMGVASERLVGVCMERSLELAIALLGVLKAGGAFVPLDPTHPTERLAAIAADVRSPVWLTQGHLVDRLGNVHSLCLDRDWQVLAEESDDGLVCRVNPDDLAYVIHTSGSTGTPKGAMNTHAGICNRLLWMQESYRLTNADRVLQKTPINFDVSVWEYFWPLLVGARLVIAEPESHKSSTAMIGAIVEHQITTIHFVPSMLRMFLADPMVGACTSLRRVICSGEQLPFDLQERFFDRFRTVELHNLYGPTEAAIDVTAWACQRETHRRIVPIGRPIANTQTYVLDPRLRPTPVGVPGELHIGGVGVGRGYINRPELTAEKFLPDPFTDRPGGRMYATGDLARYLSDGNIEFLGRLDHQVKIRGARIELGEVEATLSQHAGVREAVAIVREDRPDDKRLVAYFVANNALVPTARELRSYLAGKLPPYMLPSVFVPVASLPLTPSGKIDRRALPAPIVGKTELGSCGSLPAIGSRKYWPEYGLRF